jgi:hypothetical protein
MEAVGPCIKISGLSTLIYWLNYDRITTKLEMTVSLFRIYCLCVGQRAEENMWA